LDVAESDTDSAAEVVFSPARVKARRWQLLIVSAIVIAVDQLTKFWAVSTLSDRQFEGPLGSGLRLVYNRGSAFSFGEGFGPVFGVLALVIAVVLIVIVKEVERPSVVFGLGLIQGGAIGNVIDRLFRDGDGFLGGAVIDFLEIGDWWPVFNLADAGIVVGGVIVALMSPRA